MMSMTLLKDEHDHMRPVEEKADFFEPIELGLDWALGPDHPSRSN